MISERGGIARFGALLGALDPQGSPAGSREVAELLWLAANLPPGAVVRSEPPSAEAAGGPAQPSPDHAEIEPGATAADGHEDGAKGDGRLYLPDADAPGAEGALLHPASPVRVAGASALPRRRALARSLRPLKRRVPSTTRLVLDEDATAERIADEAPWMPVLVPARDRWLDLALVLDVHGDGAALWQPLGRELLGMLQELGAFRDIRTYWLRRRLDGSPGLATGPHRVPRSPATASDPTGRTVTLLLTDGVDPGWGGDALRGVLRQWARNGPAAILQALPEHLWGQTALAPEPGRFRSAESGRSPARLRFTPYMLGARAPQQGEVAVPVLAICPEWLAPWARAVGGAGEFDGAAVRLPAGATAASGPLMPPPTRQPVGFEEFLAQSQPRPFRLAAYLSAAPLNLAVMRLVQSAMLPDSPPSDLAEVVFSGLLRRLPTAGAADDPLQQAYEFTPGVRERLLSTLRRDEADQVIASVSAYVERNVPAGAPRFTAAFADPDGTMLLPAGARHWADVQNLVRRRRRRRSSAPATAPAGPTNPGRGPAPQHGTRAADERPAVVRPDDLPAPPPDATPAEVPSPPRPDGSGRRFLIAIGVSRYGAPRTGALPGVTADVARVRAEFEAHGYTAVLPELAHDPTASVVLRSIESWVRGGRLRTGDAVVVYFAGHAFSSDREATLMTFDSDWADGPDGARGVTVAQLHRAFSGARGGLLFVLDTCYPSVSTVRPGTGKTPQPPLWLLSCVQVVEDKRGSTFARALTAELADVRHGSASPADLPELASRIGVRMRREQGAQNPGMVCWGPVDESGFDRFFAGSSRSVTTTHTLTTDMLLLPTSDQANAMRSVSDWLRRRPDDRRPRIVTGDPGWGKTTLLGLLDPHLSGAEDRESDGGGRVRTVLLDAARTSAGDLWRALAGRLDLPGDSPEEWTARLADPADMVVVLLDNLQECRPGTRRNIVESLIRPLRPLPRVRFVISADSLLSVPELGTDVEILRLDDRGQRGSAEAGARRALHETDPAVLDALLALPRVHLIIDGSNVAMSGYPELPLDAQRFRLLDALAARAVPTGAETTCVFDRPEAEAGTEPVTPRGVRVLFPGLGTTSDEFVHRLVAAEPPGRPIVVVSTDREVAVRAVRAGARPVNAAVLLAWLSRENPESTVDRK
ncbi:Caspase domain-containing protein [Streptomyces sp. 2131.1]|uniref:NYN domain-containing protein n=1 Tax=Streptomyces sp. 2131.1 TaxID=1855346 RepID=UPI000899EDC2|nr:Caspase domain-containing protein [Streptomyces sp. 2131.1]